MIKVSLKYKKFPLYIIFSLILMFCVCGKVYAGIGYYCSETDQSRSNWCASGWTSSCNCTSGYTHYKCNTYYSYIICKLQNCSGMAYRCDYNSYTYEYDSTTWCAGSCNQCSLSCNAGYVLNGTDYGCGSYDVSCTRYYSYCTSKSCGTNNGTCRKTTRTVNINPNNGTCSTGTHTPCYGASSTAPGCTRVGYTLSSYSLEPGSTCGGTFNSTTGVCSSVTSDISIKANWAVNYYTISAYGNGGTCSPASQSVSHGSASGQVDCQRDGYNFTGFTISPSANCGGTFNSTTGVCSSVVGPFSITAQWAVANQAPSTPTTPYCMGATNPTNVTTQTPYFSAIFNDPDTNDQGAYYEIEVNTSSGFNGTVMWDTGIQSMALTSNGQRSPNIYYNGSTLGWSGTTYYWRIRFGDVGGLFSDWSPIQTFTMHSNIAPTAPTSLQTELATNPVQVTDTTPEFRAIFQDPNTGDMGIQYEIEVNTASDFSGTVMWDSGLQNMTSTPIGSYSPEISYSGTPLTLNGATYYWRIRFVDNYGYVGAWSATANFRMNNIPTATNPKTNGQTNPSKVPMTPYFTAVFNDADTSATGTYYEVEVNTASNFAGTVMWDSGQTVHSPAISNGGTSSNITYGGSALSSGVLYYWRIRFWDDAGTPSNWSTTSNFRTTTPPSSPTGLLVDGQTNPTGLSTFTPTFSAIHNDLNNDSATHYEIEVNSSSAFNGTVMWDTGKTATSVNNGSRSPNYIYAGTPLTGSGTTYYWRIRFWDVDDNTGAWSTTATFKDSLSHFYLNGLRMNGIRLD